MSPRPGAFVLLLLAVVGGGAALTLAGREPAVAASNLPNRLFLAQLAADSGSGTQSPPGSVTATPTRTATPTPTPTVIPEPMPTYVPPDPYYPYPY